MNVLRLLPFDIQVRVVELSGHFRLRTGRLMPQIQVSCANYAVLKLKMDDYIEGKYLLLHTVTADNISYRLFACVWYDCRSCDRYKFIQMGYTDEFLTQLSEYDRWQLFYACVGNYPD